MIPKTKTSQECNTPISFTNINARILNKILANRFKQHIKDMYIIAKGDLSQKFNVGPMYKQQSNTPHDHLVRCRKAFAKSPTSFHDKNNKLE